MKSSFFCKLLSFFLSLAFGASAQNFKLGDISYDITADDAVSVSYGTILNNTTNCILIPETVSYRGKTYAVTGIRDTDFSGCSDLAVVTIPASVTVIDKFSIKSNDNISGIICLAQKPPKVDGMSFSASNYEKTTLFVPKESLDAYKAVLPWSSFSNIQPIKNSHLYGDVNGNGFVEIDDVSTLIDMLLNAVGEDVESNFPELDNNGLLSPNNSRVLPLESMGADYDNIDGGSFNYSPLEGDIFFKKNSDNQIFVYANGDTIGYSAKVGVLYINKHTLRMYSWNGTCMVELGNYYNKRSIINDIDCTDSEFSAFSVGQVGYSLDRRRFEIRIGDDQWWYYLPDSTRIYCDASTSTLWRWNNNDESFVPVGGGKIEVVNDLTTGGEDKALSAEMGKRLGPLDNLVYDKTDVESLTWVSGSLKNYNINVDNTYTPNVVDNAGVVYCILQVLAGDVVTFWCKTDAWNQGYILCDSSDKVIGKSGNWTDRAESDPFVLTIEQAGTLYISSNKGDAHGGSRSRTYRAVRPATTTDDGIMTKEQVAQLNTAGGPDVELLTSYVGDRTDIINGEYIVGHLDNYGKSVGQTYTGGTSGTTQAYVYCEINVLAGDVVTIWGETDSWSHLYLLCDTNNVITKASGTWASVTESEPTTLNITADGKLWASSKKSANYGLSIARTYRSFRVADAEHDGLMPKEIAAMFGGGDSGDDAASLKLKSFAFIGDSFSAPGAWQSTMVSILGALTKKNKSVSGGTWVGTGSVSAYYQAQQLVSDGVACDYILCVLGTNDINNNVALGDIVNSETIGTASGNVNPDGSITGGVQATLITLKNAFPNAIIKIGYTPAGYIHDAFDKIASIEALCNRLKELSYIYGVGYIETRDCGICPWMAGDAASFVSGGHPTGLGQKRIGEYMARKMLSNL